MSSRARSSSSAPAGCAASSRSRRRRSASASSSTSISPGPTASWKAAASTRRASGSAANWPAKARSMPTSSCRCRIPACRRRSATPQEAGLPFELGIIRNHYVGRTFIEPTDQIRHLGVRLKHNANRADLEGKRVILVDDSIVRGTTSTKIVEMVRHAGAREVHMRISSPPTSHSVLLRHRDAGARPAARGALRCRRDGQVHRRRQPRLHLDRRALPGDGRERAATRWRRASATPASPATTRSRWSTPMTARSRCSCRCWPRPA